jgi:hypothetical protein
VIDPTQKQLNDWKIKVGGTDIPIGATGVYHPFTNKKQNFVMQGLTGCTAIFVVVGAIDPTHVLSSSDLITVFTRHLCWPSVGGFKSPRWRQFFH